MQKRKYRYMKEKEEQNRETLHNWELHDWYSSPDVRIMK
jgi:hypothetical protein